jgi:ATP-binding cassette subfamily C (CFTR/MRP) protein 2
MTYLYYSIIISSAASLMVILLTVIGYYMSRNFNARMMFNVLHSKIEGFIARVPTARIMNRFSRDLMVIDMKSVYFVNYFVFKFTSVIIQIMVFGLIIGIEMILMTSVMLILCIYTQRLYMNAKREVMRVSSISKTPILNTLIDTCRGLPNIRSAKLESWSLQNFIELNDESSKNELVNQGLTSWYSVRASTIVSLVVVLPSFLLITYIKKSIPLAQIVVIMLVGSTIGWDLNEVLSNFSQLESAMIAVERCHHFEKIEPEPQYKSYKKDFELVDGSKSSIEKLKKQQIKNTEQIVTEGSIEFRDMSCKYATSQNPILSKLSFTIKPREKIGVIGRTGSGKSTLIKLLWRALDFYEGDIKIDGKSIKEVDLKSLRSQIMIVTQETALIEGTLRENIDIRLEDKSRDAEITAILTKLGFANPNYLKDGLDMAIDGEGSNLSAGEKQLISFARTLLDKKQIMILDEATANIDLKTEEKIQACVDQDFKDTTMLIIAHRIQTIMNCDRILILEKGKMAALDTPANLSNQKDSYFNNIINKMKEKKN